MKIIAQITALIIFSVIFLGTVNAERLEFSLTRSVTTFNDGFIIDSRDPDLHFTGMMVVDGNFVSQDISICNVVQCFFAPLSEMILKFNGYNVSLTNDNFISFSNFNNGVIELIWHFDDGTVIVEHWELTSVKNGLVLSQNNLSITDGEILDMSKNAVMKKITNKE